MSSNQRDNSNANLGMCEAASDWTTREHLIHC